MGIYNNNAEVTFGDYSFIFAISNPGDIIQSCLNNGEFFDANWLQDLQYYIPKNATILDVGANVGNHTIFFAAICQAEAVIPFELNPAAITLLRNNIESNDLNNVDLSFLGTGCSAGLGRVVQRISVEHNLGASAFEEVLDEDKGIPVDSLDNMIGEKNIDFIKIDVEEMELKVLLGASRIVKTYKPMIYIEVWDSDDLDNLYQILQWMSEHGYEIIRIHGPNLLCECKGYFGKLTSSNFDELIEEVFNTGKPIIALYFALAGARYEIFSYLLAGGGMGFSPREAVLLSYLKRVWLEKCEIPVVEWRLEDVADSDLTTDRLYRNQLANLLFSQGRTENAFGLAIAGLDHTPADSYCNHLKSVFLERSALFKDALECAERAYENSVADRLPLRIRLADLIRTHGKDLRRAKELTEGVPAMSPFYEWSRAVRDSCEITELSSQQAQ